ncbi:acyltransferase family protein [Marinibacterium profundimaris]|uniref:acyltransferase family protein n=1 Tax=Marinibacterium profundimaris TaxID=1679460 RepID=UPI0038CC12B6
MKLSSFAAASVLFLIAVSYSGRRSRLDGKYWLTFLGRNSYAIYLIHLLPMSLFRAWVGRSGPLFEAQPAYIGVAVLVALLSCAMFVVAVRTVLPNRMCRIVLG